jgi:ABC-type phosphate/phosphonate transport system substrate-binding protein
MIANARMYSVTPGAAALWRQLLQTLIAKAGLSIDVVDHAAPAPIGALWQRRDKAAVLMCGLPYSLATPQPALVAAPVPALAEYENAACYWTDFVVRRDSAFGTLSETFGYRLALTTPESQSGYAAPLHALTRFDASRPLYREVVAPCITPLGALNAVIEGHAEVAPLDSYALALFEAHAPAMAARVRSIARSEPTPIPAFVASGEPPPKLVDAFLAAEHDNALRPLLDKLLLTRFRRVASTDYEPLRARLGKTEAFWRCHRLAETIHPEFAHLNSKD